MSGARKSALAGGQAVRAAWMAACAGTMWRRPGESRTEIRHVLRALVIAPPRVTAGEVSSWIDGAMRQTRYCDRALLELQKKFFGALPPDMAAKTIVGALWDYTEEL